MMDAITQLLNLAEPGQSEMSYNILYWM